MHGFTGYVHKILSAKVWTKIHVYTTLYQLQIKVFPKDAYINILSVLLLCFTLYAIYACYNFKHNYSEVISESALWIRKRIILM